MTRDEYIDLYFEEMDLGPRLHLRAKPGAPSPEDERAERAARLDVQPAPVEKHRPAPQKIAPNATLNPEPAPLRAKPMVAMPPATGRGGATAPVCPTELANCDWPALEASIRACRACGLCRQRRQAVPGIGDYQAEWLFVGEGPGAEEDVKGEPFVGAAGQLLDNMLRAIGLKRGENVYIGNAVKCRPPNNRTPEPAEMAACRPYLERQIALLQPKLIVLLGRAAAHSVLGTDDALGSLRGRLHRYQDIPVVVTYHPAYLLRTLQDKAKAWEDLCLARRTMREIKG